MLRSQNLPSCNLASNFSSMYWFNKSFICLTEPVLDKECRLIASLQKNNLQINAFLASGNRMEKNLEALLIKVTESLGGEARREILSSINKSLSERHNIVARDWVACTQLA